MLYPCPTGEPPQCRCGHPTNLLQSHTLLNPNRWFYKCASQGCNYFQWADKLISTGPSGTPQQQQQWCSPQQQHQHAGPASTPQGLPRYAEASAGATGHAQQGFAAYTQQQSPAAAAAAGGMMYGAGAGQQQRYQSPQQQQQQPQGGAFNNPGLQQQQQQKQQKQASNAGQYGDPGAGGILGDGGGMRGSSQGGSQGGSQQQYSQLQQQQQQWQQGGQQWPAGYGSPAQPNMMPPQQQGWQQSPQQQQQQPWNAVSPQQQQQQWQQPMQQQQHGNPGTWQGAGATTSQSPMQQQQLSQGGQQGRYQQSPPWPASPQQPGVMPPMSQSPQQQHTPGGAAPAAVGSPGPSPRLIAVRVLDVPSEPDWVGFKLAGYSRHFVDAIKETPYAETGRKWDHVAKVWQVRRSAMEAVIRHLTSKGYKVVRPGEDTPARPPAGRQAGAGGDPGSAAVDLFALESSDARLIDLKPQSTAQDLVESHIPTDMWAALLPHQQQGVLAGIRRGGRLLLADDMGLGKTAQAITLAACYPADWPLLVICPTSLLSAWAVELEAWLPPTLKTVEGRPHTLSIRSDNDKRRLLATGLPSGAHILLTTYKLVQQLPQQTLARYNVVICDESHKLKNPTTNQSRFVGSLVRGAKRAFLLTGTPLLSRPIEAWAQVDMLRGNLCGSYDDFGKKYCILPSSPAPAGGRGWRPKYMGSNPATANQLHQLLLANVMVRRTKGQSGVTLPEKTRLKVSVSVSAESKSELASIRTAMDELAAQGATDSPEAQRLVNGYRMATGEAKVDSVIEFLRGLPGLQPQGKAAAPGNGADSDGDAPAQAAAAGAGASSAGVGAVSSGKVLVFAHHQGVLDAIETRLCEADGLGYVRIDGRTSGAERQAAVSSFQGAPRIRVALMSIKAAGTGLTLTAADTVVFAELDWNPTDLMQCEDRIHRVGQKHHCRIYYCVAAGSADSLMWGTLLRKLRVVGATVDGVSDAQGLSGMQYWQQVGSQQSAGAGGEAVEAPASQQKRTRDAAAAAAAGGDASAGAAAAGSDGGPSQLGGDKTARRSLFGEFMATGRMPGEGCASAAASGLASGSAVTGAGAPISAAEAGAAGSQGERSAQAHNNTEGTTSAAVAAGADVSAEQGGGADGLTPPDTNDWVVTDADETSGAAHPAAGTQGSRSLLQEGDAPAEYAAGGCSLQQQQGQVVSAGRMVAVCAAASGAQVSPAEGVEATGSAPEAPLNGSPADDPAAKRQRQG